MSIRGALLLLLFSSLSLFAEFIPFPYSYHEDDQAIDYRQVLLFITEPSLYKRRLLSYVVKNIHDKKEDYPDIKGLLVLTEEEAYTMYSRQFYRVVYLTSWNRKKSDYLLSWEAEADDTIDLLLFTKLNPYEEKEAKRMPVDAISTASELSNIEKTAAKIFRILSQ